MGTMGLGFRVQIAWYNAWVSCLRLSLRKLRIEDFGGFKVEGI